MASTLHNNQPTATKREGYIKPRRRSSFSAPVVFVLVVLGIIFVMSLLFRVSDIQVEGNTHYTDEEIIRAIDIEPGDNLFFFNRFAAFARVYSKLPYIENGSVERQLPNKVIITVEETTALAYLELGEEQWTLDHNCKVLGKAAAGELESLIPIVGIDPGTLLIGEQMQTEDQNQEVVDFLADIFFRPVIYTPRKGADTAIRLLLDEDKAGQTGTYNRSNRILDVGEKYFHHMQMQELWDRTEEIVRKYL